MTSHHLACDLGAESGRVMLGTLADGKLGVEELHRFPNTPLQRGNELHWDVAALFDGIKAGLRKAADRRLPIASLSADSWGVDYMLFDASGSCTRADLSLSRSANGARGKVRVDQNRMERGFCGDGHSVHAHQHDLPACR